MLNQNKPVTPSLRQTKLLNKKYLDKKNCFNKLIKGLKRSFGKNNQGKITVRHRGGGHKRSYRFISFNRKGVEGTVQSIEYDPNRSANIAGLLNQKLNQQSYILAPEGLKIGDSLENNSFLQSGNSFSLRELPLGSIIHNISLHPKKGGQLIRSAGTSGQLLQKTDSKYAKIRLASGQQKTFLLDCQASIGLVSNPDHKNIKLGKAGRSRWLNKRPKVRGVAKNPVDHPHGGGEGKTSGGRPSVSFSGRITKGKPTRKKR